MKKLSLLLLTLATGCVHAQGTTATPDKKSEQSSATSTAPSPSGVSDLLKKLRMKVEQFTPQKKLSATTAVGGVRGAEVEASDVYWKGEAKPQVIDEDELTAFQKGINLIEDSQLDPARAAFTDFLKAYPDSMLKNDATEMLKQLATSK